MFKSILLFFIIILTSNCLQNTYPYSVADPNDPNYPAPNYKLDPTLRFKFRPYAGIGFNLAKVDKGNGDDTPYCYGGQFLFYWQKNDLNDPNNIIELGVGFTLGYIHFSISDFGNRNTTEFFNYSVMGEALVGNVVVMQVGVGVYYPIGDNTDLKVGWMFGYGYDIPITDWLRFPVFARFDILDDLHATVTFITGFTFKFK